MPLTIPAEISNERFKDAEILVFMIEVPGTDFYVANKDYTLSLTSGGTRDYVDLIKAGTLGSINHTIPTTLNRISSRPTMNVKLISYQNDIRSELLQPSTNLTGEACNIYFKYDTSSTAEANRLQVFQGYITKYDIKDDVISISVQADSFRNFPDLPKQTAAEISGINEINSKFFTPLQYGDFDWSTPAVWYSDLVNSYAAMPLSTTSGQLYTFAIASHLMKNLPTTTQLADETGADAYVYARRDNKWVHFVIDPTVIGLNEVVNSSSAATIKLLFSPAETFSHFYVMLQGGSHGDYLRTETRPNESPNLYDGDSTTSGFFDGNVDVYNIDTYDVDFNKNTPKANLVSVLINYERVSGSVSNCIVSLIHKVNHTVLATATTDINTSDDGDWVTIIQDASLNPENINDYYVEIRDAGSSAGTFRIYGVVLRVEVQEFDPDNEDVLFIRCQGREFSGTWDGRKTAGNLINTPQDMLESLFRDEFSYTVFNTTLFDNYGALHPSYVIGTSLYIQTKAEKLMNAFAKAFNVGISLGMNGELGLVAVNDSADYSQSDSDPATDIDIIDHDTVELNGVFNRHPILENSFRKRRTPENDIFPGVRTLYLRDSKGNYNAEAKKGNAPYFQMNNPFTSHLPTINAINTQVFDWKSVQRWIIKLSTFNNMINGQHGDIMNIRHPELTDAILNATINTAKWVLVGIDKSLSKGVIGLTFVELDRDNSIPV